VENGEVLANEEEGLLQVSRLVVNVRGAEGGKVELLQVGDPVLSARVVRRVILVPVAEINRLKAMFNTTFI